MSGLFKALSVLESRLIEVHGISLNEAMVLCCIGKETVTASAIVEGTGLKASHASKVIRSVEDKGLLVRSMGEKDKRQMYFSLTDEGWKCVQGIKDKGVEIPEMLLPLFKNEME